MLSFPTTPKQPGLCSCCDTEVFNILRRFPEGHPMEGEVRSTGAPLENAYVIGFVTLQGSVMEATFCQECAEQFTPEDIPGLWARICLTNDREMTDAYRKAINYETQDVKPLDPVEVARTKQFYLDSTPIGVLYVASWRKKI